MLPASGATKEMLGFQYTAGSFLHTAGSFLHTAGSFLNTAGSIWFYVRVFVVADAAREFVVLISVPISDLNQYDFDHDCRLSLCNFFLNSS